jgi:hypothetical protein
MTKVYNLLKLMDKKRKLIQKMGHKKDYLIV